MINEFLFLFMISPLKEMLQKIDLLTISDCDVSQNLNFVDTLSIFKNFTKIKYFENNSTLIEVEFVAELDQLGHNLTIKILNSNQIL